MDFKYKCFKCEREFDDEKKILSHLKFEHFIRNNAEEMKCLLKGNYCTDTFYQYTQLKLHIKKCKNISCSENKTESTSSVLNSSKDVAEIELNNDVRIS